MGRYASSAVLYSDTLSWRRGSLRSSKRGMMEDQLNENLAWLFLKTEEEIIAEAEVAALYAMFRGEDPRPEGTVNNR